MNFLSSGLILEVIVIRYEIARKLNSSPELTKAGLLPFCSCPKEGCGGWASRQNDKR